MKTNTRSRFDDYARRHPRLMLASVITVGILATCTLLASVQTNVVLYQLF